MKPRVIILYEIKDLLVEAQKECKVDSITFNKVNMEEHLGRVIEKFEDRLGLLWDLREELKYVERDENDQEEKAIHKG